MQAPPTRYKVIERGRRLEVIDTWTGQVATPQTRAAEQRPRQSAPLPTLVARDRPAKLDQRGQRILRTAPWYDAKGPREIVVTAAGETKLNGVKIVALVALGIAAVFAFLFWPLLFVAAFMLGRKTVREQLRTAATAFLDDLNQPLSSG